MILRPYQRKAVDDIFGYFESHGGDPVAILPTAAGKSVILATFIRECCEGYDGTRVLVLTHVAKLLKQNCEKLLAVWPEAPCDFYSASVGRKNAKAQILFAGIQSVWKQAYALQRVDVILIDECFTGDTLVSTPSGPRRIDKVSCGDIVYNQCGMGTVEAVSIKAATEIYTVEFDNGVTIRCTGNHPFFTECGWIKASDMEGHRAFSIEDMSALWQSVPSMDHIQSGWIGKDMHAATGLGQANILLSEVCKESGPNFIGSPGQIENQRAVEGNKAQAHQARRERAIAAFATVGTTSRSRSGMGSGACGKDECGALERSVSERLQVGHCKPEIDDRNRVGGRQSQHIGASRAGSEKGCALGSIGVVRVSREERSCIEPVFNLQVSGHPSYFANGVAVHNCHLVSPKDTTRYRKFLADVRAINPHVKIIGLTATPWRLDSGMLYGQADSLFTDCCHETTIPALLEGGYLCPVSTKRTHDELDVSSVGTRGGEFIASELQDAVDRDEITRACVTEIVNLYARPGLVFATGVKHAYHIRDEIRERGYTCEVIDGDTDETQRDAWINDMRAGKLDYLSNCGTLTTGIDIPELRMIGDMAPTKSPALHVQKIGRLMRFAPGKSVGIVLDFARNVDEHGPIDLIKPKPKGKKGDTGDAPVKTCPECESKVHASARGCLDCGYLFPPPAPKFEAVAGRGAILSAQIEPEWIAVKGVNYARHTKPGKPDSMKVTYQCGLNSYAEWVCLSHEGGARRKAEAWWIARGPNPVPASTDLALTRANELRKPSRIKILRVGKYPQIIGYDLDSERKAA